MVSKLAGDSQASAGTTTIIPFPAQHKGNSLLAVVDDYAFHLIISDPTPQALDVELPGPIARGITSFKVYMTYDLFKLTSVGRTPFYCR